MIKRITLLVLMLSVVVFGQPKRPGAVFLTIWPGSRPTALGGCFTAISDDASAAYYNPGGLGYQQDAVNFSLMHVNWLPGLAKDMYYEYLAVAAPFKGIGTFAFNGIYLTTGETVIKKSDATLIGSYNTFDFALGLSYGRKLNEKVALGGGLKLIYSYLIPEWIMKEKNLKGRGSALSWAMDAGVLYKPFDNVSLGLALQNIGSPMSFSSKADADPLPLTLRAGFSYKPLSIMSKDPTKKEQYEIVGLKITGDIAKILVGMFAIDPPEVDSLSFFQEFGYEVANTPRGVGFEVSIFKEILSLRLGYFYDKAGARGGVILQDKTGIKLTHLDIYNGIFHPGDRSLKGIGLTYGAGIKYGGFQLDIGIDEKIYDFTTQNRKVSISYTF